MNCDKDNPGRRAAKARRRQVGFTLIELLTIIGIIMLLVGLLVPTVLRIRAKIIRTTCLTTVNLLTHACEQYSQDFNGGYPPSCIDANIIPGLAGWQGCELLPLYLTGYGPDLNNDGNPDPSGNIYLDDGYPGFGFRTHFRGKPHGPYNGAEKVKMGKTGDANNLVFFDSYDNRILYYNCRPTGSDPNIKTYVNGDNTGTFVPPPANIATFASDANGRLYRSDFLLMTPGPDVNYLSDANGHCDPNRKDIVTNFLQE